MDAYGINRDSYFLFIVFSFVWYPPPQKNISTYVKHFPT